ncbi:MAG: glycosyl hydrolase family 57 [Cyanobacteria bacterium P01_A01_bin.3]
MVAISTSSPQLPELRSHLPNLCGWEAEVTAATQLQESLWLPSTRVPFDRLQAAFACALHMHQPTIPAGANGEPIGNLQHMFEYPHDGDNHNASTFAWCYARMGEFILELVANGCSPRIMLDYSGNLLWGLRQMGRNDVLDSLTRITCDRQYWPYVEWLGTMWSHAVVPSTPIPDIKLHIQAWQHHFAAIFGWEALRRVKGFSPPEMHLPNHPDTLFEYVKALKDCGYRWLLVQEHSVEQLDGTPLHHDHKYVPNRLVARNSRGDSVSMTALIKTQGSDTKLVAQMQPYHEAKGRQRQQLGPVQVPSLVTQIADGENGGVMMNEFPRDFPPVWYELRDGGDDVAGLNGTEYLELLEAAGVAESDFPVCQAVGQHKIWNVVKHESATPEAVEGAIAQLKQTDHQFHMDGASWTNDLSWVQGYENILEPMNQLSSAFHQRWDRQVHANPLVTRTEEYQQALLYNLLLQTSCFRYWGQGTWTDYARSFFERGMELVGA